MTGINKYSFDCHLEKWVDLVEIYSNYWLIHTKLSHKIQLLLLFQNIFLY